MRNTAHGQIRSEWRLQVFTTYVRVNFFPWTASARMNFGLRHTCPPRALLIHSSLRTTTCLHLGHTAGSSPGIGVRLVGKSFGGRPSISSPYPCVSLSFAARGLVLLCW